MKKDNEKKQSILLQGVEQTDKLFYLKLSVGYPVPVLGLMR